VRESSAEKALVETVCTGSHLIVLEAKYQCSVGRLDEVVTHSSGEKTVPGPMQDIIMSGPQRVWLIQVVHSTANPLISITSAVMFGCERPQAKIDVHNVTQLAELRNKIW
jgi:hypothetical protein